MGWVSINRPNEPEVYFGIETGLGEGIEICDSCNEPKPASSGYFPIDRCWLCYRCQTVNQRDYK